jgi:predicted nucleotidyltransferase
MSIITNPIEYAKSAVEAYRSLYGADLVSIILFGSAAGADFDPKKSDINLLIILTMMDIALIAKSAEIQEKLSRRRFAVPLFMDKRYIADSHDSYPMELLDMKQNRHLLFGEDVLACVAPKPEHLRLQVERELKGKWLHLLREFGLARTSKTRLLRLADLSLRSFLPVFRALLTLKGKSIPSKKSDLIDETESVFSIADKPFRRIADAGSAGSMSELETRFVAFSKAIKALIDRIENT